MIQTVDHERQHLKRTELLICRNCLCCASSLSPYRTLSRCWVCHGNDIESIPVCENESYRLEYDSRCDMIMEFSIDMEDGIEEL